MQLYADHPAGDDDRHHSTRLGQDALDARRAAVHLYLAHVETANVERGVPRRALDPKRPWVPRVQLDLALAHSPEPADDDRFAPDNSRSGGLSVVGGAEERLHVGSLTEHHAARARVDRDRRG